ncbi:hypothetical protein HDU76_013079 [Blyttiomyces sp. JEL0837]|nr:hypothetical protein HDU76_013079 [Blyttiomyces sp. JEL0837]
MSYTPLDNQQDDIHLNNQQQQYPSTTSLTNSNNIIYNTIPTTTTPAAPAPTLSPSRMSISSISTAVPTIIPNESMNQGHLQNEMKQSMSLDMPIPKRSAASQPRQREWHPHVKKVINWMTVYKRYMIGCHFAFIAFNCYVVLPITLVVNKNEASTADNVALSYIEFALWVSAISIPLWTYITIITLFQKANQFHLKFMERTFGMKRRTRKGEEAGLNPFESTCDELANIWFYAVFTFGAILVNCVTVIADEFADRLIETKDEIREELMREFGLDARKF